MESIKLSDFRKLAEYQTIHLKNSRNGRIVANSKKGLDKFNEIEIHGIFQELEFGREKNYARPIIICWVYDCDVERIKTGQGLQL